MTDRESSFLIELLEAYRRSGRPEQLAERTRLEACPGDRQLARLRPGNQSRGVDPDLCRHVLYCDLCFRRATELGYLGSDWPNEPGPG